MRTYQQKLQDYRVDLARRGLLIDVCTACDSEVHLLGGEEDHLGEGKESVVSGEYRVYNDPNRMNMLPPGCEGKAQCLIRGLLGVGCERAL